MDDGSLAEQIRAELAEGLKTGGLDWTHFLAKYASSKGVLYHAIGRFFREMEPEVRAINEAQAKLGEAKVQLKSLDKRIEKAEKLAKERERNAARAEKKSDTLQKRAEQLDSVIAQKGEALQKLQELEKLGFSKERLETLHSSLLDMGAKRGLKPEEVADAFFAELEHYDAKIGFEQEIQRLAAVTQDEKRKAEKWSAEAEACKAKYRELQEAVTAVQSLSKRGAKPKQIVAWNSVLNQVGGVEELEKCLHDYQSLQVLIAAKEKEQEQMDTKLLEERAAVKTLAEQRAELEASIKALRVSVVQEIEKVGQAGVERVAGVAQAGCDSIEQVGKAALAEAEEGHSSIHELAVISIDSIREGGKAALAQLKEALSLIDQVCARALEVGSIVDQAGDKLSKSRKITEATTRLLTRVEGSR